MSASDQIVCYLRSGHDFDVNPGVVMIPVVLVPFVEQSDAARLVFDLSVGGFVGGELSQALRVRRGATRTNLGAEAFFRAMFTAPEASSTLVVVSGLLVELAGLDGGGGPGR